MGKQSVLLRPALTEKLEVGLHLIIMHPVQDLQSSAIVSALSGLPSTRTPHNAGVVVYCQVAPNADASQCWDSCVFQACSQRRRAAMCSLTPPRDATRPKTALNACKQAKKPASNK
eukprot:364282-Chlamydomonas_euryale.AAC.30